MRKSVFKATALVLVLSLVAKVIGFLKTVIQASYFGASPEMDAFNLVNGFVSNVIYMLMTAVSVAFVPLYIQKNTAENERKSFATKVVMIMIMASLFISIILTVFGKYIIQIIAPTFNAELQDLCLQFFRILCVGIVFSLLANIYTSILNAEKHYYFSTACSFINSAVLILFIVLFSKQYGVWSLTMAILASYIFQWIVLYIPGRKYARISLQRQSKDESIKLLMMQALPILVGQATIEINQVVDRSLLSGVETGAVTAVSYAAVLYQFVAAVIATPLSTVMFTEMAEAGKKDDKTGMAGLLQESAAMLLLLCIPIMLVTVFDGKSAVEIVYGRGKFDEIAVKQCTEGLVMYIVCLFPSSFKALYSRAYYSLNDTRHPMVIGILEVVLNIILSVVLVKQFGIAGVVGATAIAACVFSVVMYCDFNRRYIRDKRINSRTILKCLASTAVTLIALAFAKRLMLFSPFVSFLSTTVVTFVVFFGVLILLKEETVKRLTLMLLRKRANGSIE